MKEFFCMSCDHVWMGFDLHCPHCGSSDIVTPDVDEAPSHEDGHYEGSFNYLDESGE